MGLSRKEYFIKDLVIDDEYGEIKSDATIQDAAKKMKELSVPDLVVVDKDTHKVLGVIADFDIVQNLVAEGTDCTAVGVLDAMYTIKPVNLETPVVDAFTRMRDLNANVIPVVDNGNLVGVASIQDCWSFIPDQDVDEIGFIPVRDTRTAEFWFASVASILAFVLAIILPLAGAYGFFTGQQSELLSLFGTAEVRAGPVVFNFFEARGIDFLIPFTNLANRNGPIWIVIIIFSILVLVFGILGLFSIIFSSYSDIRKYQTGILVDFILPILTVVCLSIEWILFAIAFATAVPTPNVQVDAIGLTMSIISMILIIAAIYRDYFFRQKRSEVSS